MKNNFNIIICGSLAYDRIMDFPGKFSEHILEGKTHILNATFMVNRVKESFGGTAGNIAYNLARLGERPKIVAVAGRDFGKYKKWLVKNKIDISGVKVVQDAPTAGAYIMTDRANNQITAYWPGSETPLTPLVRGGKVELAIIASDTVARMREYAKIFRQNKIRYIFDPGQQAPYYSAAELKYSIKGAKMLISNDYESQLILDKLKIKPEALAKLVEILVITKGGQGLEIYCQNKKTVVPAVRKKAVVDPTGAGDALRAGFIKGLALDRPLLKCARLGLTVAAYAVESQGTQNHRFTWKEVVKRYGENYGEKI